MDNNSLYNLMQSIISYYKFTNNIEGEYDSSEDWKRKAGLVQKPIPDKIDTMVEKVFIQRLQKFMNEGSETQIWLMEVEQNPDQSVTEEESEN